MCSEGVHSVQCEVCIVCIVCSVRVCIVCSVRVFIVCSVRVCIPHSRMTGGSEGTTVCMCV